MDVLLLVLECHCTEEGAIAPKALVSVKINVKNWIRRYWWIEEKISSGRCLPIFCPKFYMKSPV